MIPLSTGFSVSSSSSSSLGSMSGSSSSSAALTLASLSMTRYSISDAIAQGDVQSIHIYGSTLHYLSIDDICACLSIPTENHEFSTPFVKTEGTPRYEATALAYIDIYARLARQLPREDFARLVFPFLLDHSQPLIYFGLVEDHPVVLNKCAEIWRLVESLDLASLYVGVTAQSDLFAAAKKMLTDIEADQRIGEVIDDGEPETVRAFGQLLQAMELSADGTLISPSLEFLTQEDAVHRLEAWLACGKQEHVAVLLELLEPIKDRAGVATVIDRIHLAKNKFDLRKKALEAMGLPAKLIRQTLRMGYRHSSSGLRSASDEPA